MSWWPKNNNREEKKHKININAICPYCEGIVDKVILKIIYGHDFESEDSEYEWEFRLLLCPHCKKILPGKIYG